MKIIFFFGKIFQELNYAISLFRKILREFNFPDSRFQKILGELNFTDLGKKRKKREIFFPRKFLPLK